ncbi:MAG: ribosome-associated translation inhibitor RaiA [Candidatus Eisenbacteria bacterium]|nr:ribosome-associated translation inhibitor RaiA [Candidatus Eisenbacteria bacterium]
MKLRIRALDFELTPALRNHVDRRLRFALARFNSRLQQVTVHLSDLNGPRGGADKQCLCLAEATALPTLVIREHGDDLYAAVDRAVDRLGRNLARAIERLERGRRARIHGLEE